MFGAGAGQLEQLGASGHRSVHVAFPHGELGFPGCMVGSGQRDVFVGG